MTPVAFPLERPQDGAHTFMANNVNQFLVVEAGRINYDIYRREQYSSPFISLPRKVKWMGEMGEAIDNIMWERPQIDGAENDWGAMSLNGLVSDALESCIPPADRIKFRQTLRRTSLFHKAVHSPRFCVNDLLYTGKAEKQMQNVEWGLSDMVRLYWIKWNRQGYTKLARKYVLDGTTTTAHDETHGLIFPPVQPTTQLTNGYLDFFYNLLELEQGRRHALSIQNGRPVYGLITDMVTSRNLIRSNTAIREDFRYGRADALLQPMGFSHTYNGFVHMIDEAPPRYNFNPAALDTKSDPFSDGYTDPWVEVPHYLNGEVNPAYLAAGAQDSYIYVRDAYQLRVPGSITSVSRAKFNPQTYMGDFTWQNVINIDESSDAYNPDGTIGRFRGVLRAGVEPINPHVMFVLRHKVCPASSSLVEACPS